MSYFEPLFSPLSFPRGFAPALLYGTRACVRLLQITARPELPKSNCKSELDKCEAMEATQTHRVKKCTWGWTQHRANIETKY